MRTLALFFLSGALACAGVPEITTLTGKTYRDCEIVRVHPDGVSFTHATGAAKVLFEDLPAEWRARLGYDPVKAEAWKREQEEKRKLAEEARRKREAELSQALALAQQIELARLRGMEEQARAQVLAAQAAPRSVVPEAPPLGAVHDAGGGWSRATWYAQPWYGPWQGGFISGYGGWPAYPGWGVCAPRHRVSGSYHGRAGGVIFSIGR